MLDFDPAFPAFHHDLFVPLANSYPTHQASPSTYLPASRPPSMIYSSASSVSSPTTFAFDPFGDEDDSQGSGGRESSRVQKVDFLRQRERMRRVVAWVDGVNYGFVPNSPSQSESKLTNHYTPTTPVDLDTPCIYYNTSAPCQTPSSVASEADSSSDEEPYLIYSTPLPSASPPAPIPAPVHASPYTQPFPQVGCRHVPSKSLTLPPSKPIGKRVHRRMQSLSSIREEDEPRA